jgi:trehalose-6-phosphate synthase
LQAYCEVNAAFAESTLKALRTTLAQLDAEGRSDVIPVVWVHDYQLLVAATTVRQVSKRHHS